MKEKKKRERRSKLKRSVTINGAEWEWQVSTGFWGVVVRSPGGTVSTISMANFTGRPQEEIEAILNDWDDGIAITPGDVKEYIETHLEELS